MRSNSASQTALLIASSLLLAERTPDLQKLVIPGCTQRIREILTASGQERWLQTALDYRIGRSAFLALERVLLPGILLHWLVRKRWLDLQVQEAWKAGCRQIVVLGAGLDTLAWRWREQVMCFELDHPMTQSIKSHLPVSNLCLIEMDFMKTSAAFALSTEPRFRADLPTFYVAEGLLMYLSPARVSSLFQELAGLSAPGSRVALSFMEARHGQSLAFHNASRWINFWLNWRKESFLWGISRDQIGDFLKNLGWKLTAISSPEQFREQFLAPCGLAHRPLATGESLVLAELSELQTTCA